MSNYVVATNFGAKDALASGNPAKLILGAQLTTEFNNIATAVATKLDSGGAGVFTTVTASGLVSANLGLTVAGGNFTSRGILDQATATALTINSSGALSVAAPTAGNAFTATGLANAKGLKVIGSSTVGQSYGIQVLAGTNSTDLALEVLNQSGLTDYFYVAGDGGVVIGSPTGTTLGVGTLNVQNGISINNSPVYAGIPQNVQNATYSLVLSDANKNIHKAGGIAHTDTIPANASVAFPVGTAITFTNINGAANLTIAITTDTLVWSPSGTTGSRTLAGSGVATALKVASTTWMISGSGLT